MATGYKGDENPWLSCWLSAFYPCQTCPIYLATRQENFEEKTRIRIEIVRLCKELYGTEYQLEDITDCDGCQRMENDFPRLQKLFDSAVRQTEETSKLCILP